ncbi:PLP-dependent transferase [Schaalia vaccimaxillae]|uniref:PLP-dependent transferase n=1 Tax=Schaalia vaccimaxillae TaxID=183916 RepID=UPI0003B37859|nr:PLP-dependent transferase [Schaalia vaccimaxillae]
MTVHTFGQQTLAIHVGSTSDERTGDVVPPLHIASTHVQDAVDKLRGGYEYGRAANPTRDAFTQALAALEGGGQGFAFPSGLSAEDTLIRALTRPGDHVSFGRDVYGGTFRLFTRVLPQAGITASALDLKDHDAVAYDLAEQGSVVLWVETPSNPMMEVFDIQALADIAHEAGAVLVVDNTFASPYLQQPLALGADVVVHSTTKYVGGHSDLIGGAVVVHDGLKLPAARGGWSETGLVAEEIAFLQMTVGAVQSPRDAHVAHRGLKTLAVRMDRHCTSALEVARFLADHPRVTAVHYPGLEDDPGFELTRKQMPRGAGGVVSFQVGSAGAARAICESTKVFALAVSLGSVESLIEYPPIMTHGSKEGFDEELPDDVVRLAVGLEDVEDLIADLDQAIAAAF